MKDKIFKSESNPSLGSDKPRGIRNNNPLNLRRTNIKWKGEKTQVTDNEFEEFETMTYGLRAGLINIRTQTQKGFNTLEKLISRWAPPSENNTENYIKIVSEKSGFEPTDDVRFERNDLFPVVAAMCEIESGLNLTKEDYEKAWSII